MKISITHYGQEYGVVLSDESTIDEVLGEFKGLLLMVGFHEDNIKKIGQNQE